MVIGLLHFWVFVVAFVVATAVVAAPLGFSIAWATNRSLRYGVLALIGSLLVGIPLATWALVVSTMWFVHTTGWFGP